MGDILFLAHRIPYPPDRGDKIRGFHILKYLAERKRVHLVAFADDTRDMQRNKEGLARLAKNRAIVWRAKSRLRAVVEALLVHKPVSLTAFDDKQVRQQIEGMLARHAIDTIYVFSSQMAQYLPPKGRQRVIMDFVDMDSAKFAAYAAGSRWPASLMMRREARFLFQFERAIAQRADASLFVSAAEAELFRAQSGAGSVHAVENGIDTAFFDPAGSFKRIDSVEPLIVFTGQMDYRPNIEAVCWFHDAIFPHIRVAHPEARFVIVGRNPADAVQALARQPGVTVTGEVKDVRGWLAAAAVVVAPLKLARGVQNKVLEAMAMARPVVASAAAAEGIDHAGTIRVGDDVADIADAVNALIAHPQIASDLGRRARAQVEARYSWAACLAPLDGILGLPQRPAPVERRSAA